MDSSILFCNLLNLTFKQALASCKDFRSYLQWVIDDASETVSGQEDEQFPLTLALSDLLQGLSLSLSLSFELENGIN